MGKVVIDRSVVLVTSSFAKRSLSSQFELTREHGRLFNVLLFVFFQTDKKFFIRMAEIICEFFVVQF